MRNEAPPGAVPGGYADGPGRRPGIAVWDEPPTVPIQKAGGQARNQAADLASGQAAGLATLVAIAEADQSPGTHRLPGMRQPPGRPRRAAPPALPAPPGPSGAAGRASRAALTAAVQCDPAAAAARLRGSPGGRALPGGPVRDLLVQSRAAAPGLRPGRRRG